MPTPLKPGDRIRIIRLPPEWKTSGFHVPYSTRQVYRRLIARRRPLTIYEIDDHGLPWIRCQFKSRAGRREYHFLVVDDGCRVRVVPRPRRKQKRPGHSPSARKASPRATPLAQK